MHTSHTRDSLILSTVVSARLTRSVNFSRSIPIWTLAFGTHAGFSFGSRWPLANFAVGFRYFSAYALEVGALTKGESDELWCRCWNALGEAAEAQGEHQTSSEPAGRFLELLAAAISSGRAHLSGALRRSPR